MELATRTSPPSASQRKPGPMPANRRCSHPDCITPLSRYNRSDSCSLHGGWPNQPVRMSEQHRDELHEAMEMAA
jgi:hypothetical protein